MALDPNLAADFLEQVYTALEFKDEVGYYNLTDSSLASDLLATPWLEQAAEIGAETVFFVHGHPTVLFFRLDDKLGFNTDAVEESIRKIHIEVWNTSRIPLFFVALPTEVRVYSAYQKPARTLEEWESKERALKKVQHISQILEALKDFSRSEIESGRLFQSNGDDFRRENRVDRWLLRNLRLLRQKLGGDENKKREYVHALIGRSIFIRYLEDREVLVKDYFIENSNGQHESYADVLRSKVDTFFLFRKLREDFNGDIFPLNSEEEYWITEDDLFLLRNFLSGKNMGDQIDLFFWAYKFDIIPIEFISSIYEEFYDENSTDKDTGTHYTPTSLVDFILSQTLTEERLSTNIRVLDPSCGSGVFLVEAFKRIVQFTQKIENNNILSRQKLTHLLTNHIFGIDINASAIQVAAFSLYLAFLDYLDPPDIRQHKQLPKLIYHHNQFDSGRNLYNLNIFLLTQSERSELQRRVDSHKKYLRRIDDIELIENPILPIDNNSFDIIIGNPPWGSDDTLDQPLSTLWCRAFGYVVGDKELSQSFMRRVERLLKQGGEIGLLVSTGVLFKHEDTSVQFRQEWLQRNQVRAVYNFAHVREIFFRKQKKEAIAPFVATFYTPHHDEVSINLRHNISYFTIKKTRFVEHLQVVVIDSDSLRKIRQSDLLSNNWLWKSYMWGDKNDAELIGELKDCYPSLSHYSSLHGRGYQEGGGAKKKSTKDLGVEIELRETSLLAYVPQRFLTIDTNILSKPTDSLQYFREITLRQIHALGQPFVYHGPRLLIKRGISRSDNRNGEILARLADSPFAFKNSIIGVRLDKLSVEQRKVVLGILLSSLTKYYHFLTCSTWGFWHDEIHVEEHLSLPICLPQDYNLELRIIRAVDLLVHSRNPETLFDIYDEDDIQNDLDEAIFELYSLSEEQQDLVRDLCRVTLEFFYDGSQSKAVQPPSIEQLEIYRDAFIGVWQDRLAPSNMTLECNIYAPYGGLLCGLSFELKSAESELTPSIVTDDLEWRQWFKRLQNSLTRKYSSQLYIERMIKELGDSSIFIVKRSEQRLWTKSQARQDAKELLTEVFKLEWQRTHGRNVR